MVEAQQAHHARTGRYTDRVSELNVVAPLKLQLQLNASGTGWAAETRITSMNVVCAVAADSSAALRAGQKAGVPFCYTVGEAG